MTGRTNNGGSIQKVSDLTHDQRFDLSHRLAEGSVAEMALADAEEFRARPVFIEFFEVGDRGNSIVEAAGEQDS